MHARATLAAIALLSPLAGAQLLDLGEPEPPAIPAERSRISIHLETLRAEIDRLMIRRDIDPTRREAAIAARKLAVMLLERDLEAQPAHGLWGLTLAARMDALDDAILDASGASVASCALLISSLSLGEADIPEEIEDLDRLMRDAFAPLAMDRAFDAQRPSPGAQGWIFVRKSETTSGDVRAVVEEVIAEAGIPAADADGLRRLAETLAIAQGWPGYGRSAERTSIAILGAAPLVIVPASWIPEDQTLRFSARVARDFTRLADASLRTEALADLTTMSTLRILIDRTGAISRTIPSRELQSLLATTTTIPSNEQLAAALDAMDLLERGRALPARNDLIQPLRPPYETMLRALREREEPTVRAIVDILRTEDAMSSQSALAAIASHRRALEDASALTTMSGLLENPEARARGPVLEERFGLVAREALALGRRVESGGMDDSARREFRELIDQTRMVRAFPRMDMLEAARESGDAAWRDATGGRLDAILDAIDEDAAAWLDSFRASSDADRGAAAERLALLARVTGRSAELVTVRQAIGGAALDSWPGVELGGSALDAAASDAGAALSELTRHAMDGRADRVNTGLDAYDERFALLRLAAYLERKTLAAGFVAPGASGVGLCELASGAPQEGAWLADRRERLARISLMASHFEVVGSGNSLESELKRYVNSQSAALLERLPDVGR